MYRLTKFKYFGVYLLPISVYVAFNYTGFLSFLPVLLFFGLLPILELFLKPDRVNMDKEIAQEEKNRSFYDWVLFMAMPVQVGFLIYFLWIIQYTPVASVEFVGRIVAMGIMCGVLGINVGHELGHRLNRAEQFLGELLLLTSLDTHFLPYHNGGHHLNVATPNDSSTAKKGQWLIVFWVTSHFGSYVEAWKLENDRMRHLKRAVFSWRNRMVVYSFASIALLVVIYLIMGITVLMAFVLAAILGIILLETINYIEHYGLLRTKNETGSYEQVRHQHSWNSDHPIGRTLLFNLSRHSDHHYNGSKKYQILESHPTSPQMPTGYPGMMILAVVSPLWFSIMDKKLNAFENLTP